MRNQDWSTFILRSILRALGSSYPVRLSLGFAAGFVAYSISGYLKAIAPENLYAANLDKIPPFGWITAGVLLFFLPLLFKRKPIPENITNIVNVIETAREHGAKEWSINQAYDVLLAKVAQGYTPSGGPTIEQIEKSVRETVEETKKFGFPEK